MHRVQNSSAAREWYAVAGRIIWRSFAEQIGLIAAGVAVYALLAILLEMNRLEKHRNPFRTHNIAGNCLPGLTALAARSSAAKRLM